MYEDDTPPAERRAQALSLDRDLLRELLGQEELRDLIDPGALEDVETQLRGDPRNADELHDKLRLRGDLRAGEYEERHAQQLLAERRALQVRFAGEERLIAAEDAGRYRDALGVMPPGGLPEAYLDGGPESLVQLVLRYARGRGPFTTAEANARFGIDVEPVLYQLERDDKLVRGELRPGGSEREWCEPDVLRRLRRASLAALRREVEPAEQATLGRFLPHWHGIDRRATLREALVPLQGLALPVSLWEAEVLPRRVPGYNAGQLDQLCASGEVVWVGAGLDRVAIFFREDAPALGRPGGATPPPEGEAHDRIRAALGRSAEFWFDLVAATELAPAEALPALWDLVWAGEATNDAWTPLRAGRRYQAMIAPKGRPRRFSRQRSAQITATQGRWSLTDRLFPGRPDSRALAELLLERQGIVTRDGVRGEGIPGGYGAVYGQLRALETLGVCRRGYFVEGLGGAQFALPGAVERLRELRPHEDEEPEPLVLAAADPAQPYGATLPWPKRSGARAARVAGAHVVLLGGEAALFVERGGRSLVPLREPEEEWLRTALAALVEHVKRGGAKRLAVERFDGEPVGETEVMSLLLEAGFLAGPRRAVLRP
jgi:ATP-dependent Lhr-like helicase